MGKIEFTNIVIDDFSYAKKDPFYRYIHILTHIHTDHLKGLTDSWNFGPIYCTEMTAKLLLIRFPSLKDVRVLQEEKHHLIKVSSSLEVTVTLFNANHCAGSAMVLIQGYMGTILYTGDMRFDQNIFQNYTYLYPLNLRNPKFQACSKKVDVLFFDNTFLDERFQFPPQKQAIQLVDQFIIDVKQNHLGSRINIGMDHYGKEEVLVHLANKFDTLIIVDEVRYQILREMDVDLELFTTNPEEGWIRVVSKRNLKKFLENDATSFGLIMSGWTNQAHYRYNGRIYCIPYSLHSNYREIHAFVNSIRPSIMNPIVYESTKEMSNQLYLEDMFTAFNIGEQLSKMREMYSSPFSQQYKELMSDPIIQKKILQRLDQEKPSEQTGKLDIQMTLIGIQTNPRKKYKLSKDRDQDEIDKIKNKLMMRKKQMELQNNNLQIVDDGDIQFMEAIKAIEEKDITEDKEMKEDKKKSRKSEWDSFGSRKNKQTEYISIGDSIEQVVQINENDTNKSRLSLQNNPVSAVSSKEKQQSSNKEKTLYDYFDQFRQSKSTSDQSSKKAKQLLQGISTKSSFIRRSEDRAGQIDLEEEAMQEDDKSILKKAEMPSLINLNLDKLRFVNIVNDRKSIEQMLVNDFGNCLAFAKR